MELLGWIYVVLSPVIAFQCFLAIRYERALNRISQHPGNRGSTQAMRAIAEAAIRMPWQRKEVKRRARKPEPQMSLIPPSSIGY